MKLRSVRACNVGDFSLFADAPRLLALPAVVLLGLLNTGCPSSVVGNSGGSGGTGATGGAGGSGGADCTPTAEVCDGKDNDCNGVVDDVPGLSGECECNDGAQEECYTGPDGTVGVGSCASGVRVCKGGTWGECSGESLPVLEVCNLTDDDCNGIVDDMGTETCGFGGCEVTIEKCVAGEEQSCVPTEPTLEVCDGIDNNCNQIVDESDPGVDTVCSTGQSGACSSGKTSCIMGALVCVPDILAVNETCDGVDNNCDGTVDNDIPGTGGTCNTGQLGVCAQGGISCQLSAGSYQIDCFPVVAASTEICDGLDNDCNGQVDDNNPEGGGVCDTGQPGACQAGTVNCLAGSLTCTPNAQAQNEICNGADDNCDGQVDEGNPGGGQGCGCGFVGITACQNGQIVCNGGPVVYFQEDFSDNSAGWTLGTTWQIGPAVGGCSGCTGTPDPGQDHTPTADNGLAGVIIGGPAPTNLHDFYWLESPPFDTSMAAGPVYLSFWRWLNSDYLTFMQNKVQVFNGSAWVDLPFGSTGNCCPGVMDASWQNHGVPVGAPAQATNSAQYPTQFDLTAYKSTNMRIRFGYNVGSDFAYTIGSWSVDDVIVSSAICP